jgi:hypothetical protein
LMKRLIASSGFWQNLLNRTRVAYPSHMVASTRSCLTYESGQQPRKVLVMGEASSATSFIYFTWLFSSNKSYNFSWDIDGLI